MSSRILTRYEEERNEDGPHWTLEVQRSAAGQPGLLFTVREEMHDPKYAHLNREMTVVVSDGWAVVEPILNWLEDKR